jgi:hypothetical protein
MASEPGVGGKLKRFLTASRHRSKYQRVGRARSVTTGRKAARNASRNAAPTALPHLKNRRHTVHSGIARTGLP